MAVRAVTRRFGRRVAVDKVDFSLGAGNCLALFGPNGAGKTTLLRLLGGLLKPDDGSVLLDGVQVGSSTAMRARIGLISHRTMLYPALTAKENVEFSARMYGATDGRAAARRVLGGLGVELADIPVRLLSRGMQQRVSIARAIVNSPALLLADEPYTGLDDAGSQALTSVLRSLKNDGAALVLVTHQLNEGLEIADFAAVMVEGAFVQYQSSTEVNRGEYAFQYRDMVTAHA